MVSFPDVLWQASGGVIEQRVRIEGPFQAVCLPLLVLLLPVAPPNTVVALWGRAPRLHFGCKVGQLACLWQQSRSLVLEPWRALHCNHSQGILRLECLHVDGARVSSAQKSSVILSSFKQNGSIKLAHSLQVCYASLPYHWNSETQTTSAKTPCISRWMAR